eukprot:TRINITY_DN409_c0_g1_i1.p2 TRINITY_DN409_c0_g1~~TRINITY_DN409_c0_g1_i1.p2  ORF type:complete len:277 (-),score=24.37 TRINITY_DN409_c0_g1_i1:1326-2111(-)
MTRFIFVALVCFLFVCAATRDVSPYLVVNDQPFLDKDNDIWSEVKEIIVKWLPGFVKSLPYPDQDIRKGNVHVQTYNTKCDQFDIYEQDLDLAVIPGFPNITANVKTMVPYAEYQTGVAWSLYHCIWRFTCYGSHDVVTAKLYNFELNLNVTLDINPFDTYSKSPQIQSVFIDLNSMQLGIKSSHWYSQWMYNVIMRFYGRQIDEKATTALNSYLQKELKTIFKGGEAPDFFQGELGEKLRDVALQYETLKQNEGPIVVEM